MKRISSSQAFTIVEIMIALAIIGVLAAITVPLYLNHKEDARISKAIMDVNNIGQVVLEFFHERKAYPASLADVGMEGRKDPWGNAYEYLPDPGLNKGQARKDRNLVPLNSDFDLYSKGKDGQTAAPLTAKKSHDDIVRANNGRFVGLGSDY
jgi:general secretion pathway protein G